VGTTDTRNGGDVDDFGVTREDVAYLVEAVGDAVTSTISSEDVVASWAGWRPLARSSPRAAPSRVSREDVVEETARGFVTVAGGKLTTYRRMAEVATDRAVAAGGWRAGPCVTALRPLVPSELGGEGPDPSTEPDSAARVRGLFGPDADDVFARWKEDPTTAVALGETFPFTAAEVERAAREMVATLGDLVDRRLLPLPEGVPMDRGTLERTAAAAAVVTRWDTDRQREEVERFRSGVDRWPTHPGVPTERKESGSQRIDGSNRATTD
jgi:glycerol-3-phosphate dehydrogenase